MRVVTFFVTIVCGTAIAYSFMLILTTFTVWMVRNQSLMEMWWMFSSLARYPKEIFSGRWAEPLGKFFTYIVPILVVVNVPSNVMVRVLDPPDGRSDHRGRRGPALAQPPVLPVCAAVVSQREQLNRTSVGHEAWSVKGYLHPYRFAVHWPPITLPSGSAVVRPRLVAIAICRSSFEVCAIHSRSARALSLGARIAAGESSCVWDRLELIAIVHERQHEGAIG